MWGSVDESATEGDAALARRVQAELDAEDKRQRQEQEEQDRAQAEMLQHQESPKARQAQAQHLAADEAYARRLHLTETEQHQRQAEADKQGHEIALRLGPGAAVRKRQAPPTIYEANFEPTYPRLKRYVKGSPAKAALQGDGVSMTTSGVVSSRQTPGRPHQQQAAGASQPVHGCASPTDRTGALQQPHSKESMDQQLYDAPAPSAASGLSSTFAASWQRHDGRGMTPAASTSRPCAPSALHIGPHQPSSSPSPPPHAGPPARLSSARSTPTARARRRSFGRIGSDAEDETFVPDTHDLSEDASSDEGERAARGVTPQDQLQPPPADLNAEPDWFLDDWDDADMAEAQDKLPANASRGGERGITGRSAGSRKGRGSGGKAVSTRGAYTREALERLALDPRWLVHCKIELDGSKLAQHAPCQPGPPFFLYEQVFVPGSHGIAMLRDIPHHLKEDACLVMDAGWHFSCARRLRMYCTNLRGHARAEDWVAAHAIQAPRLRDVIRWPAHVPWPAWAARTWPEGRIHTVNTQQLPDKACLNACANAIADAVRGDRDAELPKETTQNGRTFAVAKMVKAYTFVPCSDGSGGCRALTAKEVELIMGFPKQHTKKDGAALNSEATRRKMLGNSFQVANIMYLLSPLKALQDCGELPEPGICVLSLFDGIGGAIVALQRLRVKVRILFTCEKDRACEQVVKRFVQQKMCSATHRTEIRALGDLKPPVGAGKKPIDRGFVQWMLKEYGCHLVIGGSPCNNITGNNRQPASSDTGRAGFAGRDSQLFHEFVFAKGLVWEEARLLPQAVPHL